MFVIETYHREVSSPQFASRLNVTSIKDLTRLGMRLILKLLWKYKKSTIIRTCLKTAKREDISSYIYIRIYDETSAIKTHIY